MTEDELRTALAAAEEEGAIESGERALLEGAGARVEWVPHNGQHEIPPVAVERLAAFARACLAPANAG